MHALLQDLRYALRTLARTPGWTAVVVLSLALGTGAVLTTLSWVQGLVLRPVAGAADPDRLVALTSVTRSGHFANYSYPDFRDYRDQARLLAGVIAFTPEPLALGQEPQAEPVWAEFVSGNFFDVLGVRPVLGRTFAGTEKGDTRDAAPVVVLSHGLWMRRFQGDRGVIGRTVRLNRRPLTVVGVAPEDFHGGFVGFALDLWVPLVMQETLTGGGDHLTRRAGRRLFLLARLAPGATVGQAHAEVASISRQLAQIYPATNQTIRAAAVPVWKAPFMAPSFLAAPVRILAAVSGVVLLIVCANVANLLLARAAARRREFAIRLGLGAGSGRMFRQVLTESLVLAGAGAGGGLLCAAWMNGALLWLVPETYLPVAMASGMDARVAACAAVVAVAAGLACGIAPALDAARFSLAAAVHEGARGVTGTARSQRLRRFLVMAEVALATVVLVGAGLFVKSFRNARASDPGFDPQHVLLASFSLASSGYNAAQGEAFFGRLRRSLESASGVASVSYANKVPLGFKGHSGKDVEIPGYTPRPDENMRIPHNTVAPGYFATLRIPQLAGRDFTELDGRNAPRVVIVNETFVRRFFGGGPALGRKVNGWTVVGVVKDGKYEHLEESPKAYMYLPFAQDYSADERIVMHVRTAGPPENWMPVLRRDVRAIDPNVAIFSWQPLAQHIGASLFVQRSAASLLSVLAVVALLVAALGLYGVIAYAVAQRTREIGIRIALGAQPRDVLRMVVGDGLRLSAVGIAAGGAVSVALGRTVAALLFGVNAADAAVLASAAAFLAAVALAASWVPARRALRVDPAVSLRCE